MHLYVCFLNVDIDECALNLHECSWNETCVNGDGFYYCDDPANASSEDDVLSKCPVGYTFNGDKQVCDGRALDFE